MKPALTMIFALLLLTLGGCVTTANECGNEQRDWNSLAFPKSRYCSIPGWVPLRDTYEAANKAICKVHDNNSGIYSSMSSAEADHRFLCDYMKRSEFPWGVRHVTGYLSYFALRTAAASADKPEQQAVQNSDHGRADRQCDYGRYEPGCHQGTVSFQESKRNQQ